MSDSIESDLCTDDYGTAEAEVGGTCPLTGGTATAARDAAIADAVATIPPLCDVDEALLTAAEQAVTDAAGSAFDACLAIAKLADPDGVCEEGGESEVSEAVVLDAQARYASGPGVAVAKFGEALIVAGGTCDGTGASTYTDADVQAGIAEYQDMITRSLQAYGIQNDPDITLGTAHPSGVVDDANADENIQDVVEGNDVDRSDYGNAPGGEVKLSDEVLSALETLGNEFTFTVSEIAGASHSATSRHYDGVAIDVSVINGRVANASNPSVDDFEERCEELGATEVIGPPSAGHETHVHAAWDRP
jgi:hypothetical protein